MLDISCHDFNWMQQTNLEGIDYIGGDIVKNLIVNNNATFENKKINFWILDLTRNTVP